MTPNDFPDCVEPLNRNAAARVFLIEGVVLILLAIPARNSGAPGEVIDLS